MRTSARVRGECCPSRWRPKSEVAELADERDDNGRRLAVRNGHDQPRQVATAAGAVEARAPRVNDERMDEAAGECKRFSSANPQPPWRHKSPKVSEVLPPLHAHDLSFADSVSALETTKRVGSAAAALVGAFKPVESAQQRSRPVNAPHRVALVRAGADFERGHPVERGEVTAA